MSITDELREYVKKEYGESVKWYTHPQKLLAIADRIDAEHEKAMSRAGQLLADAEKDRDYNYANWQECKQKVLQGNITFDELNARIECLEDALSHCIELPMDADGEYIHIGDEMEWVRYEGSDQTIVRKVSGVGNGVFFAWSDEQGRYAQYESHAYRHYHAPTVEDVLEQALNEAAMLDRPEGYWPSAADITNIVNSLVAKLRLADDGKEQ